MRLFGKIGTGACSRLLAEISGGFGNTIFDVYWGFGKEEKNFIDGEESSSARGWLLSVVGIEKQGSLSQFKSLFHFNVI